MVSCEKPRRKAFSIFFPNARKITEKNEGNNLNLAVDVVNFNGTMEMHLPGL